MPTQWLPPSPPCGRVPLDPPSQGLLTPDTITTSPLPRTESISVLSTDPTIKSTLANVKKINPQVPSSDCPPVEAKIPSTTKALPSPHEGRQCPTSRAPTPALTSKSPSPRTPFEFVYQYTYDKDFGRKVCDAYERSLDRDGERVIRYGEDIAREWKRGSTPEEARKTHSDRHWEELDERMRQSALASPSPGADSETNRQRVEGGRRWKEEQEKKKKDLEAKKQRWIERKRRKVEMKLPEIQKEESGSTESQILLAIAQAI
ncbi:MAG: hypothetical protein Q9170_002569 [Blastenia crenularia]